MDKVKLKLREYEAMESCSKEISMSKESLIEFALKGKFSGKRQVLNDLDELVIIRCVLYGYELEETKEEKLLKIFKEYDKEQEGMIDTNYNIVSKKKGILECLDVLEIKIDGINN